MSIENKCHSQHNEYMDFDSGGSENQDNKNKHDEEIPCKQFHQRCCQAYGYVSLDVKNMIPMIIGMDANNSNHTNFLLSPYLGTIFRPPIFFV